LIVQKLAEVTQARHGKYANTVYHLEPNIKDGPGGLRDCNVVHWLTLVASVEKLRDWPSQQSLISPSTREQYEAALDFLMSVRSFLHFRQGRDDNQLNWEAQAEAAAQAIGVGDGEVKSAEAWMRVFFQQARAIHRVATQLLEEIPASRSSLYREFQSWRSRLSNSNFSVVNGFILLQQPGGAKDPELLLSMFEFVAEHGLKLGTSTEHRIEQVLPTLSWHLPKGAKLWAHIRDILVQPHAADALRAMHHVKLLNLFMPELEPIDSLVIRDYYHRFTVDEHSFRAIESLHRLSKPQSEWERRFQEILAELDQPELLYLALLLHDVGKGVPGTNHVETSLAAAEKCLARIEVPSDDRELVKFLIGSHLEISATLRRDIFDPATIHAFAEKVGTPERLKMLCLMTYADIGSVNPEALTPWKAENIWQLYITAMNHLNRTIDQELVHANERDENLARLRALAPQKSKKLNAFLEGLPQRYLKSYPADAVLTHLHMAGALGEDPVQIDLKRGRHWFELTLVTKDRPALFSKIAGVLSAWGMNIVKSNAVSNQARVIVDTFYFTDSFRTLELNLPEWERFKRSISAVILGEADLDRMMRDRLRQHKATRAKVKIDTRIEFDNESSQHSTVVQVIAQDRPGLLHRITSVFAYHTCNIEVALIDTEGQMAIDVFYLTRSGAKLDEAEQEGIQQALTEALAEDAA
jgi:[protein-PII] uridylyltransferase